MRLFLRVVVVLLALAFVVAGCGGSDDAGGGSGGAITIGSKNFPEAIILGELYTQALEAQGFDVTLRASIGSTELIDRALTSGEIDMYPEYTGTMLTVVFGVEETPESADDAYEQARDLQAERGFTVLERTPFSDSDALAVPAAYAEENDLAAIGDLADLGALRLGGFPEFETRAQGLPGLRERYGLTELQFVPLAGISAYQALDRDEIDVSAIFSTDPQLATGEYTVLEDPEATFGFQNVAPVVEAELAEELGDDFADTVNAVSAALTEDAIIAMNSAVVIDQQPAAQVAGEFLEANDLV